MKKILLPFLLLFCLFQLSAQYIQIQEDFNSSSLPVGWSTTAVTGNTTWGFGTIGNNSLDGTPMAYFDDDALGRTQLNNTASLTSPVFDNSAFPKTLLEFDYNFREFGGGGVVDSFLVAVFNGINWVNVFETGTNDCGNWVGACANNFPHASIDISAYKNVNCQVRFIYSDGDDWCWYVGIDNVEISYTIPFDMGVAELIDPVSKCGLTVNESVVVNLINYGSDTIRNFSVVADVNNGAVVLQDSINSIIAPLDTFQYTFNSTLDFSAIGFYDLRVYTILNNDTAQLNDTLHATLEHKPVFLFPYLDDFENSNDWSVGGTNSSWELGTPLASSINTTTSGSNVFSTNLDGNYNNNETSYLYSPCYDFSQTLVAPTVQFNLNHITEIRFDYLQFEYSLDNGASWNRVESEFASKGWYALNSSWQGNSQGWIQIKNTLISLIGESQVRFRFSFRSDNIRANEGIAIDDFEILKPDSVDLSLSAVINPTQVGSNSCGLGTENIIVYLQNIGENTIDSVYLFYQINGGLVFQDTLVHVFAPYSELKYIFRNPFAFSLNTAYNLTVWAKVKGDTITSNDSILNLAIQSTQSYSGFSLPYVEQFNAPNFLPGDTAFHINDVIGNGWTRSAGFSWQVANSKRFRRNFTGPNRDYNGVNSSFLYAESSLGSNGDIAMLESPCIDLTGSLSTTLEFSYHRFGDSTMAPFFVDVFDGALWQQVAEVSGITQTNGDAPWLLYSINLDQFSGTKVKFRFRTTRIGCCQSSMAIDDVKIYNRQQLDVAVAAATVAQSKCQVGDSVVIIVVNRGTQSIAGSIPVFYSVNNGAVQTASILLSSSLASGDSVNYTFSQLVNFKSNIDYQVKVWTGLSLDNNLINDTATLSFRNHLRLANRYKEDFDSFVDGSCTGVSGTPFNIGDSLSNGWMEESRHRFNWNVQNGAFCNGTQSLNTGPIRDHTTGLGNFLYSEASIFTLTEPAMLESPCIDFSNETSAGMSFWYHRFGDSLGTCYIDVFANGVWNLAVDSLVGQSQISNSDSWKLKKVVFNQMAGQILNVRFRILFGGAAYGDMAIDDVEFYSPSQKDARLVGIDLEQVSCEQDSARLILEVNNLGLDSILPNQLKVKYQVTGGAVFVDSNAVGISVDSNLVFTMKVNNVYSLGNLNITAWVELPNDSNNYNDTLFYTIDLPSRSPEYTEGFEDIISLSGQCGNFNTLLNLAWQIDLDDHWSVGNHDICSYGNNGATPISLTGPDSAYAGNSFMYFEPAFNSVTDTANLLSTCIDLRNDTISYLDFFYHMYGAGTGKLYVDVLSNGVWSRMDSIIGQQQFSASDPWSLKTINLNQFAGEVIRVRFTAVELSNSSISGEGAISIDEVRVYNSFPVVINEVSTLNSFKLFPNPTNGEFILRGLSFTTSEVVISLVDLNGRLIESRVVNPTSHSINERFDLSNQANGIYLISIQSEGRIEVKKIVLSGR